MSETFQFKKKKLLTFQSDVQELTLKKKNEKER
jgi:hypothetical protein